MAAAFKPALAASSSRQPFQLEGAGGIIGALKTAFHPGTILLFGALFQSIAVLSLPLRYALTPTFLLTLLYLGDTLLQTFGITPNRQLRNVVKGRTSAQLPSPETGAFSSKAAAEPLVVFLLGARINHPLGIFAPGAKELGEYFARMHKHMLANTDAYGLLGVSNWSSDESTPGFATEARIQQNLSVFYFRTVEGLNEFAKSEVHREGIRWWNEFRRGNEHLGIMHETYGVPAGSWETIYENFQPTLLGATSIKVAGKDGVGESWVRPVISGSKGLFRSQYGRMGRTDGGDNADLGREPSA